jgi:exopolysaccharide production protein ExoQ
MPSARARPLFLLAALFAPVGVVAPKALVLLLFVVALWLLPRRWRQGQLRRPFQGRSAILAAMIGAWALLSALWALDDAAAFWTFARLAGVAAMALFVLDGINDLEPGDSGPISWVLVAAFTLAALLLGLESLSGGAAYQLWFEWLGRADEFQRTILNRSEILLLLAAGPCALTLLQRDRQAWATTAIAAAMAVVMLGVSNSNQIAGALALVGAVVAWWTGPWLQRLLAGLLVVGVLGAPLLPTTFLTPERLAGYFDSNHYSGLHRLHIWHFTAERIAEAPVLGWGMDASRRIPGGNTKLPGGGNIMGLHPHNASLQIWLELGGVGAVLWAVLLAGLCLRAGALGRRSERAVATGLLLAGLAVANLSFGIWQTWWLVALSLSGVMFALAVRLCPKFKK